MISAAEAASTNYFVRLTAGPPSLFSSVLQLSAYDSSEHLFSISLKVFSPCRRYFFSLQARISIENSETTFIDDFVCFDKGRRKKVVAFKVEDPPPRQLWSLPLFDGGFFFGQNPLIRTDKFKSLFLFLDVSVSNRSKNKKW